MTPSRLRLRAHLALLLALASSATAADLSAPLPRLKLFAGPHAFEVEVAATPQQRNRGLTGRAQLADGAGMLFVFEKADRHCFWMKDTPLALSIAFLADDGTIVGIADMQPRTRELHCATVPVRFALEVKQGDFGDNMTRGEIRFSGGPFSRP
ncbi:MAG: DUF192 domain-containing protein [Thiobacillus sp.]|uniref:DUF192 domain-containing protein n=1 Tax=Thiobacillus sp. TaxID=924 RepID=UPI0028947E58|nr:DUF192 domain-containing protein [Thiobacillus sp.]MDT3705948.1 DUF192 domain-containing protein [Thiobacillus sp.]